MSAVDKELKIEMLEREIHGIDVELAQLNNDHRIITGKIEDLENDRYELRIELTRTQWGTDRHD